jgi:hypothetical protein
MRLVSAQQCHPESSRFAVTINRLEPIPNTRHQLDLEAALTVRLLRISSAGPIS